jgi:hypothetical protein
MKNHKYSDSSFSQTNNTFSQTSIARSLDP